MFRRNKKLLVYFLILLAPLFLLFSRSPLIRLVKISVIETNQGPFGFVVGIANEIKKILLYHHTYQQYQQTKKEAESLKARLVGQQEVLLENKRYQRLLEFKGSLVFSSVAATVIGRDPSNWNAAVILDKGEKDGLSVGLPVVNALGVVGKITEVTPKTSKVLLLTDPSFGVAGLIQRSREGGLIAGTLQGYCRMKYLSIQADVQKGDVVISSRLSSSFPEGLLIGKVFKITENLSSPGKEAWIEPAVSISQLEEVLVIKKK